MKTKNDDLNEMEFIKLIENFNGRFDDRSVDDFKSYFRQLKALNESLRNQNEELEKDNSAWKTQAEKTAEQYHKLESAKKRLELKLKTTDTNSPIKINNTPLDFSNEPDVVEKREVKKKRTHRIDVNWMIEYAQNNTLTRQQAVVIKDMLMHYYLQVCKSPQADVFELLQIIERIPQEYDNNHRPEPQPIVRTVEQMVVNNNGNVEYNKNKKNGKQKK